ncbi:MAG: hypothetical protein IID41_11135 [Planctomycetes bacterium]|nr:hypothetical protein [Planctomycetota bacterium]
MIVTVAQPGCTERQRQNVFYRLKAMATLKNVSGCEWVMPSKVDPDKWKPGILTELGRLMIVDEDEGIAVARVVCKAKSNTKRAIAIIREARLRKTPQPTVEGAESAIVRAMNNYRDTHPDTTLVQLREALNVAYCIVVNMIDEKGS